MFFNISIFWSSALLPKSLTPSFQDKNRSMVKPGHSRLWKYALAHVVRVIPGSTHDFFSEVRVLFYERRHEGVEESENVIADQDLAVAVRSRPNADRRNLQPRSHHFGDSIRD